MFYLSKESSDFKLDKKIHTKEKLYEILDDIYLEYACGYVFYYNTLLNLKDSKQLTPNEIENIKASLENYTKQKDEQVAKKHGLNALILDSWLHKESNDR